MLIHVDERGFLIKQIIQHKLFHRKSNLIFRCQEYPIEACTIDHAVTES